MLASIYHISTRKFKSHAEILFETLSNPDLCFLSTPSQLTIWHPTPKNASKLRDDSDYAAKHWSGLISDYYAERVKLVMGQALVDANARKPLNATAVDTLKARHAFDWTTATTRYPTTPAKDALEVAAAMRRKYRAPFSGC
jgi:hypothetical protein